MKYKTLLVGKNNAIIDDFFSKCQMLAKIIKNISRQIWHINA